MKLDKKSAAAAKDAGITPGTPVTLHNTTSVTDRDTEKCQTTLIAEITKGMQYIDMNNIADATTGESEKTGTDGAPKERQ